MRMLLALVLSLTFVSPAAAQLYEWTDEKGVRQMTDDPNKIPERFRQQTRTSESVTASPEAVRRAAEQLRQQATRPAPAPMYMPPAPTAPPRSSPATATPFYQAPNDYDERQAERKFNEATDRCRSFTGVDTITKPGGNVTIRGYSDQRFNFDKCMAEQGQPIERSR
jgi:hypothetical protein